MNRTSSSDNGQERRIPEGYRAETTSCDRQDSSCRMATNTEPCGPHLHSSEKVRRDIKIAERQNEPLHSPIIINLLMTLSLSMMLITTFLLCIRLHAGGLNDRIAKRKSLANRRIRAVRRRWAARFQDWTVGRNWRHVVFSDEFRVTLFKCNGRTIVWRQNGEQYTPACWSTPRSQSRASLIFWGCIGFGRAGHLVEVHGNTDRNNYINIIQQHLPPSSSDIFGHQNPIFVFQQDNAPPHTARDTVAWLDDQDFQQMLWLGNSPDMNIIATVWTD